MEGYGSIEEQTQDYIALFTLLQREDIPEIPKVFEDAVRDITQREQITEIFLPSGHLKKSYDLTDTAFFLMMFAFCCELEGGLSLDFQEKYRERRPNVQYAFHLLSAVLPVDFSLMAQLGGADSVLDDLFTLAFSGGESAGGLLWQPLSLNDTVFYFLLTGALPEGAWYRLLFPGEEGNRERLPGDDRLLPLHEREAEILRRHIRTEREIRNSETQSHLTQSHQTQADQRQDPLRIILHGRRGTGKHTLLRRICREESVPVVFVNMERMWREERRLWERNRRILRFFCRLAVQAVVLELTGSRSETDSESKRQEAFMDDLLTESLGNLPVFFLTETAADYRMTERFAKLCLKLSQRLTAEERKMALEIWLSPDERKDWQLPLLGKYKWNIGEFLEKQRSIRLWAGIKGVSCADTAAWEAGLREINIRSGFGRVIEDRDASEEIILPGECRRQLETVIKLAKGWSGTQGLHLLFHGSSGTGKTMAASILAERLQLSLFKVDLSQIFDKYIGETEKHMDEIFHTAQTNNFLLFFDEADALFSKRTGIQDARDKYANVSTAYLLQRIEEYDGMLIMATNLLNHFDDAFVRRIRFVIKFRDLDETGRERLWEKALTGGLPVAEDVSFRELSRAVRLSPARIRAAARVAETLAVCEESGLITKEHLRRALELEAGKDETAVRCF